MIEWLQFALSTIIHLGVFIAWWESRRTRKEAAALKVEINSRMDAFIALVRTTAHAAGVKEGHAEGVKEGRGA